MWSREVSREVYFFKTYAENEAGRLISDPLLFFDPFHLNPGRREKIKLNFYFHTSLWCLKRFYEGLKGAHHKQMKIEI